jgi:hypothetical protein
MLRTVEFRQSLKNSRSHGFHIGCFGSLFPNVIKLANHQFGSDTPIDGRQKI